MATVTLKDTGNAEWADNTSEDKTFPWAIKRAQVDVPVAAGPFTYDGDTHTGVAAGAGYTLFGDATATAVGTYTVTATLADPANTEWASGGADAKTFTWAINPVPAPDEPDQPSTPDEPSEPSTPDQPATPDASNPTSGSEKVLRRRAPPPGCRRRRTNQTPPVPFMSAAGIGAPARFSTFPPPPFSTSSGARP